MLGTDRREPERALREQDCGVRGQGRGRGVGRAGDAAAHRGFRRAIPDHHCLRLSLENTFDPQASYSVVKFYG